MTRFRLCMPCMRRRLSVLGYDVANLCFEGPADRLNLTEYTQPALLVSSAAAWAALEPAKVAAAAVAGHSLGEYTAVYAGRWVFIPMTL